MIKNRNILYLALLISFVAKAQVNYSWFPAKPGVQYNFKIDSSTAPISTVIKIDSLSLNSFYHFNKIITRCDTCINQNLVNDYFDTTYSLNAQAQFLKHKFSKPSDTVFYFMGKNSFVLKPFVAIGAQWLYDSSSAITATLLSRNFINILGNMDSVCSIKRSLGDTIILSKNHGFVQFPYKTIGHHNFKLVGVEGTLNSGIKLKRFHDFFDLNSGNVLQYAFTDSDFNSLPPMLKSGNERWDILSAQIYVDSVCYGIKQTYFDSVKYGASIPVITSFTTLLNLTIIDSAKHLANLFPLQEIMTNPFYIYNNGIRGIHKVRYELNSGKIEKCFGENCPNTNLSLANTGASEKTAFTHIYLNRNSRKVVGRKLTEGLGFTSELYNDGDRIYEKCLIGYIKGADTSGIIYSGDPLFVNANSKNVQFEIFPNPSGESVFIITKTKQPFHVSLINVVGEVVFESNGSQRIDVSSFPIGVYVIQVSNGNFRENKKLIVSH